MPAAFVHATINLSATRNLVREYGGKSFEYGGFWSHRLSGNSTESQNGAAASYWGLSWQGSRHRTQSLHLCPGFWFGSEKFRGRTLSLFCSVRTIVCGPARPLSYSWKVRRGRSSWFRDTTAGHGTVFVSPGPRRGFRVAGNIEID